MVRTNQLQPATRRALIISSDSDGSQSCDLAGDRSVHQQLFRRPLPSSIMAANHLTIAPIIFHAQNLCHALSSIMSRSRGYSLHNSSGSIRDSSAYPGRSWDPFRRLSYSTTSAQPQAAAGPADPFGAPPQLPQRRVVVTGIGMVTPLGVGVHDSWQRLLEGRTGVQRLQPEHLPEVGMMAGCRGVMLK